MQRFETTLKVNVMLNVFIQAAFKEWTSKG